MDIKLKVVQEVENCFLKAESHFKQVLTRPKVSFDIRGQDAGRAYFPITRQLGARKKITEIKFNDILLEKNPQTFLDSIVAHECAHLIVYEIYGTKVKPHGLEWKGVMEGLFELDANVQHNLDVSDVVKKPYIYSCLCGGEGVALSKRQHQSARKGSVYLCKKCKSELAFKFEKDFSRKVPAKKIKGLYLHLPENFLPDSHLIKRWNKILNKNNPDTIFSSSDFYENEVFLKWLRENNIRRKYLGKLSTDSLFEKIQDKSISHCILVFKSSEQLESSEGLDWAALVNEGLILRTVKI